MEIHGRDIVIDEWRRDVTIDEVIGVVAQFWKDLVFENDGDEDHTGIFIYENKSAAEAWDDEGWSEMNDKTMLYVIWSERGFTVVIDDNGENMRIADAIRNLVQI